MTENAGTKEVMKRDPIYELLSTYKSAIKNVLPKHLTPERILRVAYTAIHRTPKLRECTHESIINAVLEISMLGLDIGRTAHIVPFGKEATFICDYKGFIDLAHRSDRIEAFTFKPVYEQDDFEYMEGTSRYIKHKPYRGIDRGELVAAYSIVFFKHGGYDFDVVEAPDIAATKRFSPGAKRSDSPWNKKDLEWTMWCKTAVRRLAKRVPQSPELQRAAYLEELAEAGLKQDIHHVSKTIDIEPMPEAADLSAAIKDKSFKPIEETAPVVEKEENQPTEETPTDTAATKEAATDDQEKVKEKPTPKTWGDWRSQWINKKEAGFSTYFHKNKDAFDIAPTELQEEARVKWLKLYPETPWPLAPAVEDTLLDEIAKFPENLRNQATVALGFETLGRGLNEPEQKELLEKCQELEALGKMSPEGQELSAVNKEINKYPMQRVDEAQKNCKLPTNRVLGLDESNSLLAECARLTKGGAEDLS